MHLLSCAQNYCTCPNASQASAQRQIRLEEGKASEDSSGSGSGSAEDGELPRGREGAHSDAAVLGDGAVAVHLFF